jgi:kojibiose phosphorylase
MVARETFTIASDAVNHLRRKHPKVLRALLRKLRIAKELPKFREAAAKLFVPKPDPKTGLIEQFDGYFGLRESTVEELKARMFHPNEYLGAGQGLAVPTKIIKQADVVMMLSLFKTRFSAELKKTNWEYYEPRTEHGSSLSACAYAMVATEFGNLDFAYKYFLKTAKIDLEAKYKVYAGSVFMGGSHPAANGGAWMTAVLGFGGVQADENRIAINPRLCGKWKGLQFHLAYKGDVFRVNITKTSVTIGASRGNSRVHTLLISGKPVKCRPGRPVTVKYARRGQLGPASVRRIRRN